MNIELMYYILKNAEANIASRPIEEQDISDKRALKVIAKECKYLAKHSCKKVYLKVKGDK